MPVVPLATDHDAGLQAFLAEFDAAEESIPAYFAPRDHTIDRIVAQHRKEERGEVTEPIVPASTRFLVEGDEVLGVYNARHVLNDRLRRYGGHVGYSVRPSARGKGHATRMLRHAIDLLRDRGVGQVLVTCDTRNLASARVIQKCGGVVFEREFLADHGHELSRYHIG